MSLARGLFSQLEVIHALVLRETRTRFGSHRLGYMWALLEPIFMILTFYILFRIVHRVAPHGMDLFGFLATGIVPYLLFATTANQVAESINGNKAMLFYPHVRPLDLVLARAVLEVVTYSGVFIVLMLGNTLFLQEIEVSDPLTLVLGFGLASLFGAAVGLVFCAFGQFSPSVDRARGVLLRPLFWMSGIFFTANSLPSGARHVMLFNPVLHATELVREGWYPAYAAHYVDLPYVASWILGLSLVGLMLERVVRRRIEVT